MTPDTSPSEAAADDRQWLAVEEFIDRIAELAESHRAPASFHAALAAHAVEAFDAQGAVVWVVSQAGSLARTHALGSATAEPSHTALASDEHRAELSEVVSHPRVTTVEFPAGSSGAESTPQARGSVALIGPVSVSDRVVALLEILRAEPPSESMLAGYERLLAAACEIAAQFHRQRRLERLEERDALWQRFDRFSRAAHGSLDLDALSYNIANEARPLIECDRVAMAVRRGRQLRVRAVSGVDQVDRRADSISRLEPLIWAVVQSGEPLWYPSEQDDLPPQLAGALEDFLEYSPARGLAVLPLLREAEEDAQGSAKPCGALVLENFEIDEWGLATRERAAAVCTHAAIALENVLEHEAVPWLGVWRKVSRVGRLFEGRLLPRTIAALLAITAAVAALLLVPGELTVRCSGRLQPELRRSVFAAREGVVRTVHVGHGDAVEAGDPLVTLASPALEYEVAHLSGEIETVRARLASLRASRLANRRTDSDAAATEAQRAIEQRELEQTLGGLTGQLDLLHLQLAELEITSPIAGQVLSPWDDIRALKGRPLERGDSVIEIGDTAGDWVVELHLADVDVGHVLEARHGERALDVSFILATDPAAEYRGRLAHVASSTDVDEQQQNYVAATVALDTEDLERLRPGASVVARVECGPRAIGYVWFHRLFETIQRYLFF